MKINSIIHNGTPRKQLVGYLHGKQVRRWFDTDAEALKFWNTATKEAAKGAANVATLSETDRALCVTAIERASKGGYDILAALGHYESYLRTKPSVSLTVSEAVVKFLDAKEGRGLRDRSLDGLRATGNSFALHCGNRAVAAIAKGDVESYLKAEWSGLTKNGYLTRLSTLFAWCVKAGYAVSNPVALVERFRVQQTAPCVLTVDHARTLLDTVVRVDKGLLPFFVLGLFCGIRPHELTSVKWENVNVEEKLVEVEATSSKTSERRLVTLSDNCIAWLQTETRPTCGALAGDTNLRKRIDAVWAASGLVRGQDVARHSFASYHVALHKDAAKTAHELGHKGDTSMLFRHYRNVVKPSDAAEYFALSPTLS